jgi:intermediate peptidase
MQHLAGTRGVIDWVEVPSHLMEHFLYDYRVVSQFARHHQTNQVIPRDMMERIVLSERAFYATDTLTRTFHAAMDQRLHAAPPPKMNDIKSTSNIVAECQQQYTVR